MIILLISPMCADTLIFKLGTGKMPAKRISQSSPCHLQVCPLSFQEDCRNYRRSSAPSQWVYFSSLTYSPHQSTMFLHSSFSFSSGEEEGFDPMGFSLAIDIRWLREAELKHGRVAMLATLGWITTLVARERECRGDRSLDTVEDVLHTCLNAL